MLLSCEEVRGLMVDGKVHIWNAYDATHFRVCHDEGFSYRDSFFLTWRDDCLYWRSGKGNVRDLRRWNVGRSSCSDQGFEFLN